MALPKLDVPQYSTLLPSTGESVRYRPFLVKEQKQLLIATGGSIEQQAHTVLDLVDTCTFGKLNVYGLPAYDIEYLFLQMRAKSVGENIDLVLTCAECENKQDSKLDLTTVNVIKTDHPHNLDLGNGLMLTMKDPDLVATTEFRDENLSPERTDAVIKLIARSIQNIWKDGENYAVSDYSLAETIEFVENLSPANLETIQQFFITLPVLSHTIDYTCEKCSAKNSATLEGLQSFFA